MRCVKPGLLVIALIVVMLITGCGQGQNNGGNAGSASVPPPIKPGGQLVYGSLYEPNTLNPLMSDLLATAEVGSLIFSGLVKNNDKGEWIPDLAAEVPTLQNGGVSPDGLTITYRLRTNVTWHDGVPFSAEDVKFTWQAIMNRKAEIASRAGYDQIVSVDTPNSATVVIRFRQYNPAYLSLFSTILPKHILANEPDFNKAPFNRAPIGTGPFKFKEWNMSDSIVLEANPNYFMGKPNLDKIIYKVVPDVSIMISQLKTGEVDVMSGVDFSQLDQARSTPGMQAVTTPSMIWEHMDFNLDNSLFQDIRVRKAIALSLDRPAMIANVLKNAAAPAVADQSPLSWAYNPALTPQARNLEAAKTMLAQAGWQPGQGGILTKDGHRLAFSLSVPKGNPARELVAQAIVRQLKDAGIEVEVRPIDPPVFFNDVLKTRRFEAALYAWTGGVEPDDMSFWNSKRIPSGGNGYTGQNYPGWRNAEVDKLTEQGAYAVDLTARKQDYFRIQELIVQECPVIPLYFRVNIDAVKNNVVNYKPNPTPAGNLWNAWQWGLAAKQ